MAAGSSSSTIKELPEATVDETVHRPLRIDVRRQAPGRTRDGSRAKALILAGGLGSRLRPLTDTIPKCLVPIGGRTLLDYWVECLVEAGISEARINTHAHAERVREHIGSVNAAGRLRLVESYEPELLGSAGTVAANADLADGADEIVIIYADNLSDIDLRPLIAFHRQHGDPLTMVLFRAPNPRACGIAELDGEGRIVSFVEKPERPTSDLANAGLYVVNAAAYREIAAMGAFDLGFDVLPKFVGRMRGWVWGGYYLDIGTHEALERARREVASTFPDQAATSRGVAPAGDLPRSRWHRDRARSLSFRPGAGPAPAWGRRSPDAFPPRRVCLRAGDQSVGHRSRDAHRRAA